MKDKLLFFLKRFALLFIIPSILLNLFLSYKFYSQKKANLVKVIGIIDGDTVVLENKTRLRLRHINAPELEFCGGQEAKNLLASLVENKSISIEEQIPDQTGRAMALIYVDNLFNDILPDASVGVSSPQF